MHKSSFGEFYTVREHRDNIPRVKLMEYDKIDAMSLSERIRLLSTTDSISERGKHQYLLISILDELASGGV